MDYPQFDGSVAFERHRRRRAQGVPTITVVVGELEVAEKCWTAWHRTARDAPVSVAGTAGLEPILRAWLEAPVVRATFVSELVQHAARAHGVSCDELRVRIAAHSEGQRERWAEQLSRSLGWSRTLIEAALETRADLLPERVRAGFRRVLAELEGLLPFGLPALWVERSGEAPLELHTTIAPLLQIAEAVPRAELAFAATEVELERFYGQNRATRALHRIRHGCGQRRAGHRPRSEQPRGAHSFRAAGDAERGRTLVVAQRHVACRGTSHQGGRADQPFRGGLRHAARKRDPEVSRPLSARLPRDRRGRSERHHTFSRAARER